MIVVLFLYVNMHFSHRWLDCSQLYRSPEWCDNQLIAMRRGDTAQQFSQRSCRNAEQERIKKRTQKFWVKRNEFDYLHLYPQDVKKEIVNSLTCEIPKKLPPVEPKTISLYRRAGIAVFQTRPTGSKELDPHMTHESLHILSMAKDTDYPNFAALTKEFERDLKLYLSASTDIHTMALIAAGNHIIGKEKDILTIAEGNISDIWVLFNHILSDKISYEALLPFVIKGSVVAFRALYEFSNTTGHESIAWFFDKQEVVDSLLKGLESQNLEIKRLALRIFGNVLGEEVEHYANTLLKSNFLDSIFKLMMSSDPVFRKDACWVLANFCSYECAATIVLCKEIIMEKLVELLYYETSLDIRKEIAHIFNYLISLAKKQLAFQRIVSPDFFQIMALYLQQGDLELSIIVGNIVFGLLSLGQEFKDGNEQNVVVVMVRNMQDLTNEILKGLESENCMLAEMCSNINAILRPADSIEEEL